MDESQITGSASSYARKYALNGLFCIDDTKDADFMDNSQNKKPASTPTQTTKPKEKHVAGYDEFLKIQKEKNVPPVEITKYVAAEFKKPRVGMLDEFEMVAALKWIKNYGQDKEGKGFTLYDNADQELAHEDAGDRI